MMARMFSESPGELPQHFSLILVPEFTMMPVVMAVDALRLANRTAERQLYSWSMHGLDGAPVSASCDMTIRPDSGLDGIDQRSAVIICGGVNIHTHTDQRLINWLRRAARRGLTLGAICTGTHILAHAGVLDGYRCTVHWENLDGLREAFPDILLTGSLFEIDRDRFSCAGGTCALDMMLSVIARQHGPDLAAEVAEISLHVPLRGNTESQRLSLPAKIGVRHPRLAAIIKDMEDNLENPSPPGDLARKAGISARQLERLFRRYLHCSPKRYYLQLRLKRGRQLLLQTDMPVINIAFACGFSSSSHFSKCYRAYYGRTPYRERLLPETVSFPSLSSTAALEA